MTSAADFDKLRVFYLGRPWDLAPKPRRPGSEPLEPVSVRPTRQSVTVTLVALAWAPVWQGADGQCTAAWQ